MSQGNTITEAQSRSGLVVISAGRNASNARTVPYVERYRQATALMISPAEYRQEAAEHEGKRRTAPRERRFSRASTGR
jgi:hypothetical protein